MGVFAYIQQDLVVNTILCDTQELANVLWPDMLAIDITYMIPQPGIGWRYINEEFYSQNTTLKTFLTNKIVSAVETTNDDILYSVILDNGNIYRVQLPPSTTTENILRREPVEVDNDNIIVDNLTFDTTQQFMLW
jgi:hypothetical protein